MTIKQKHPLKARSATENVSVAVSAALLKETGFKQLNIADIDFSPLNYRKYFSEEAIQSFAEELRQHGIISALLVRPLAGNRYELIAGERRLRAAKLAGFSTVPAAVANLTNEQVIEIQLSENLQRENPHPMHEAHAIKQMQNNGLSMAEIAARLGKSVQFIYSRIKLMSLIEPIREMMMADKISLRDAVQIAALPASSQNVFYEKHCGNWKINNGFRLHNLEFMLRPFRYDLNNAPFDTSNKKLVHEAGACTNCPSNSATLKTLFPDEAGEAVCSNKDCYHHKCTVHFINSLRLAVDTHQPGALIYHRGRDEYFADIISATPEASALPVLSSGDVSVLAKPHCPEKEEFTYDEDGDNPVLDEHEFNSALEDYYSELEAYNIHVQSGSYKPALLFDGGQYHFVHFSPAGPRQPAFGTRGITAKQVDRAVKAGDATPEMLRLEISRITEKEKRAKELDTEKVQLIVHRLFSEYVNDRATTGTLTAADHASAKLVIYQSLDYNARALMRKRLFANKQVDHNTSCEELFQRLADMSEEEFAYMVRMAIISKSESRYPVQPAGFFMYQMAKHAGIPTDEVQDEQDKKAKDRIEKKEKRIKEMETIIKQLMNG